MDPKYKAWTDDEKARLRSLYRTMPIDKLIPLFPGRTKYSVLNAVTRIGLGTACRKYSMKDESVIRMMWGSFPVNEIAKRLDRKPGGLLQHVKVHMRDLKLGVPQGCETINEAAARTGISESTMRLMLKSRQVSLKPLPTAGVRPAKTKSSILCVETDDTDATVEWYNATETMAEAARRTGYTCHTVERLLRESGIPVLKMKRCHRKLRRFAKSDVDRIVQERLRLGFECESITDASGRTGVSQGTLAKWLRASGVIGPETKRPIFVAPEKVDAIVRSHARDGSGEQLGTAAKRHGLHPTALRRMLEAEGVGPVFMGNSPLARRYSLEPSVVDRIVERFKGTAKQEAA